MSLFEFQTRKLVNDALRRIALLEATAGGASTVTPAPTPTPTPTPPPTLTGFYANGATNPAWKAALARVKAGTGRGRIVIKSDSTGVGAYSGTGTAGLVGARPLRWSVKLAAKMTAAGIPMLDTALVGDGGAGDNSLTIPQYDPRWTDYGAGWSTVSNHPSAGGSVILAGTGLGSVAEANVDRAEVVLYGLNGRQLDSIINAGYPAFISNPTAGETSAFHRTTVIAVNTGFQAFTVGAASVGSMSLGMASQGAGGGAAFVRSVRFFNSAAPAIDILNHAVCGATGADQMASNVGGNQWSAREALVFDAPDLAIFNVGINELNQGDDSNPTPTVAAITTAAQSFITATRLSGDPLIVIPYATTLIAQKPNLWAAIVAGLKQTAATNNVALFSLYEYFGSSFAAIQSQLYTDGVHGTAAWYDTEASAIQAALNFATS